MMAEMRFFLKGQKTAIRSPYSEFRHILHKQRTMIVFFKSYDNALSSVQPKKVAVSKSTKRCEPSGLRFHPTTQF